MSQVMWGVPMVALLEYSCSQQQKHVSRVRLLKRAPQYRSIIARLTSLINVILYESQYLKGMQMRDI